MLAALRGASVVAFTSTLIACASRGPAPATHASSVDVRAENQRAREVVCGDVGHEACLRACPEDRAPREHAGCLLGLRFGGDPEALDLARRLYDRSHLLAGVAPVSSIEGYRGTDVTILPALPLGDKRHHLAWIDASIDAFTRFLEALAERGGRSVAFRPQPDAFVFFRTVTPTYPSAYFSEGVIAYNVDGPLHGDPREMHETLFHELFHVNDALHGAWSARVLDPIFASITGGCGDEHDCYVPYAAHDTIVPGGTYYAFDERTRDVREYAAELALRYFLEHEAILAGTPLAEVPFKCRTSTNAAAWNALAAEFFGGVDLTRTCDSS